MRFSVKVSDHICEKLLKYVHIYASHISGHLIGPGLRTEPDVLTSLGSQYDLSQLTISKREPSNLNERMTTELQLQ